MVAVDGVSFDVARGEIFGIIGPNGAGKTTTVECLQGLRNPDDGEVSVLGVDPRHRPQELRGRIGSQLQDSALPDRLRVSEAIDLFGSFGASQVDPGDHLARWGLAGKSKAQFGDLSGGQRQRLFVALALLTRPEIVFLDEMTTGLDPAARRIAWDLIREIRGEGTTVVLVTHFMDEAETLCDRVAVFRDRTIVDVDTPPGLVASHAGGVSFTFTGPDGDIEWIAAVPGVTSVARTGPAVEVHGDARSLVLVCAELVRRDATPDDLRVRQGTLDDVYMRLTGP